LFIIKRLNEEAKMYKPAKTAFDCIEANSAID
jgi:hypothetical protein